MTTAPGLDRSINHLCVRYPALIGSQCWILCQVGSIYRQHQAFENGIAITSDDNILTICRGIGIRWHYARQSTTGTLAHYASHIVFGYQTFHQVKDRFIQGYINHLPDALPFSTGLVTMAQGHQSAHHPMQGSQRVANADTHPNRRSVGVTTNVA